MARASEDPPSPVDAYDAAATATPVGEAPPIAGSSTGYYGTVRTPVTQVAQPASKPFDDWTVFAIIALFASCIGFTVPGIVMGHLALHKIKQTGQAGRGLAIAALIVGYVFFVFITAGIIVWALVLVWSTGVAADPTSVLGS